MTGYIGKFPLPGNFNDLFSKIKPHLPDGYFKIPQKPFFDKINDYLGKFRSEIPLPRLTQEITPLKPFYPSAIDIKLPTFNSSELKNPTLYKIDPLWRQTIINHLPKDPFINLNRCINQPVEFYLPQIPGLKIKPIEEVVCPKYEQIKHVVQNGLGLSTLRRDVIELNRRLWQVQQIELPKQMKFEVQEFKDQLEKYQGCTLPIEWMMSDYFCLDQEGFTKKVVDSLGSEFFQLKPSEQEKWINKKCLELAPLHPLVEKYIPSWMYKEDKVLGLDLSKFIEAFNKKMALLITQDQLQFFERAEKLIALFEERVSLSGRETYELLQSFGRDIEFVDVELTKAVNKLNRKIRLGLDRFELAIKYSAADQADRLFRLLGCLVFPPRSCLRPPFDIKAAIENPQPLHHINFEKIMAHATYGVRVQDNFKSPFSIEDFQRKSQMFNFRGTVLDNGTISFVNGIKNQITDINQTAQYIMNVGNGVEVNCLYNATHNFFVDLLQSWFHLRFKSTESVQVLKNNILDYFEKNGLDKQMLIICHSQGALITRNALLELPQEIRDRVSVAAFGPAGYIDKKLCGKVVHFVNKWDWIVPSIDFMGRLRCRDSIVKLDSKEQSIWSKLKMGHTIQSETYQTEIRNIVEQFVEGNK